MNTKKPKSTLKRLIYLTLYFIFIQLWAAILHLIKPIPVNSVVIGISKQILHSWVIIAGFIQFIVAQILLYAVFIGLLWMISRLLTKLFNWNTATEIKFATYLWLLSIITLFFANQYLFPWSIFAILPNTNIANTIYLIISMLGSLTLAIILLIAIFSGLLLLWKKAKWLPYGFVILIAAIIIGYSFWPKPIYSQSTKKPNVIIIGVDSLRMDFTGLVTNGRSLTPNIDKFIKPGIVFMHAFTPQARTFPAWMSILTGNYPKMHQARYALTPSYHLQVQQTIGKLLQHQGYKTIFASDDRRFNNIVKQYGFNKIIAPKTGFNDFILGSFNDFLLSNLIVNTKLGKWLFPYSFSNRSAAATYKTKTFVNWFNESLPKHLTKPLFLAIHLTLPHWPFYWADTPAIPKNNTSRNAYLYKQSIIYVDKQVAALFKVLQQHHLLNHAIVFLISDHGHSLGFKDERITQQRTYIPGKHSLGKKLLHQFTKPSYGHGTDILNIEQDKVVFAIRFFGFTKFSQATINNTPVSLIDIKPTILNFLGIKQQKSQGESLMPLLTGIQASLPTRPIYIESGFTLPGIMKASPDVKTTLEQGLTYYQIEAKTGNLVIKDQLGQWIIQGKQRGVILYPWFLGSIPLDNQRRILILANLKTYQWTTDLNDKFAQQAPKEQLLNNLNRFYGPELHGKLVNPD